MLCSTWTHDRSARPKAPQTSPGGSTRHWQSAYGERTHPEPVPKESLGVFLALGYGAPLVRRLLCQLQWKEAAGDNVKRPQLLWTGSSFARAELREMQRPWQLVNRFPRGGSMGSKSSLLQNLRAFCEKGGTQPLMSFFPRAYDLRSQRELYMFILDFAVTRAEAVLRRISSRCAGASDCKHILAATRLLDRLAPLLEKESKALQPVARGRGGESEMISLSAVELAVVTSDGWCNMLEGNATAPAPSSPEAAMLAALKMEMRWWLNHLEQAPYRQSSFNGRRAFWILKAPALNCGRGVSVFCDLLPLLAQAQTGCWDFVVQKYLERPLLVGPDERKCDVRLWVLLTSWNPAVVWAWSEPYLRLASKPFSWAQDQVANPFVHLTNRCVQKDEAEKNNGNELSSDEDHIFMLSAFLSWAAEGNRQTADGTPLRDRWVNHTWPRMLDAVRACVRSCQIDVGSHHLGCFELFGFDFLLDEDLEPWLLEANSSPDLCEDAGPSLRKLTESALTDLFTLVPALYARLIDIPTDLDKPECDLAVEGSGRWHLCLLEKGQCAARDMELRRILKPCSHATRSGMFLGRHLFSAEHFEVLRNTLGSQLACVLPTYAPQSPPPRASRGKKAQSTGATGKSASLKTISCQHSANMVDKIISDTAIRTPSRAQNQLGTNLHFGHFEPWNSMKKMSGRRARSFSRTKSLRGGTE